MRSAPRPEAEPLERVSPTQAERLRRCGYRVAFDQDAEFGWLRRDHPIAALGTAAHRLLERCGRGDFDDVAEGELRDALEVAWSAEIEQRWASLDEQWPLGTMPEPPDTPGYQLTRVRLRRRLERLVIDRRSRAEPTPQSEVARRRPDRAEVWLEDSSTGIRGRPDRVETINGGDVIVDFKTGWTQESVRDEQRRQLLLYAHLWKVETGRWPVEAAIETVAGKRYAFQVDSEEVIEQVDRVRVAVETFNEAIAGEAQELADPSPDACEHCPYQSVCAPFFEAYEPDWFFERAILGHVRDRGSLGEAAWVDVDPVIPSADADGFIRVLNFPLAHVPEPGAFVAITNLLPTEHGNQLRARWSTRLATWNCVA